MDHAPGFDELTLTLGDAFQLVGWNEVRITCGIERVCRDFSVRGASHPTVRHKVAELLSLACDVKIGADLVLTGYTNCIELDMTVSGGQGLTISGRSRTQDLVDCSAEWPGMQISGGVTVKTVAVALGRTTSVEVVCDIADLPTLPQFNIPRGVTSWSVIEEQARYSAVLARDDAQGRLVLDRVGKAKAAGGLAQGKNVESARVIRRDDERYKRIVGYALAHDLLAGDAQAAPVTSTTDISYPRDRALIITAEAKSAWLQLLRQRVDWEMNRRSARGALIQVTTDSWRDAAGALWQPNTLVTVDLPSLGISEVTWLIGEVTYRRGMDGTHADLTIMAPDAFTPAPASLRNPLPDSTELNTGPAPR